LLPTLLLPNTTTAQETSGNLEQQLEAKKRELEQAKANAEKINKDYIEKSDAYKELNANYEKAKDARSRGEISKEELDAIERQKNDAYEEFIKVTERVLDASKDKQNILKEIVKLIEQNQINEREKKFEKSSVIRDVHTAVPDDPSKQYSIPENNDQCCFAVQALPSKKLTDSDEAIKKVSTLKYGSIKLSSLYGHFASGTAEAYNGDYTINEMSLKILSNMLMVKFAEPKPIESFSSYKIMHIVTNNHTCRGKGLISAVIRPQFTVNYPILEPDVFFDTFYYMRIATSTRSIEINYNAKQEFGEGINISAGLSLSGANASAAIPITHPGSLRPENRVYLPTGHYRFKENGDEVRLNFATGWNRMKIGATCHSAPLSLLRIQKLGVDLASWIYEKASGDEFETREKSLLESIASGSDVGHLQVEIKEPDWNLRVDGFCTNSPDHGSYKLFRIENEKAGVIASKWIGEKPDYSK
ncbi:MAG: hypothetical protein P1V97_00485, partial [Planctomycetota bacterium]|nr:hypothetical protein [Planctomycetota bacterium]